MTLDLVTQIVYRSVVLLLIISMPTVGVGLLIGFVISLFQAVTQIQEQTLTFVPKVIAVFLVFAFTFPWVSSLLIDFTVSLWNSIPAMAK